MTSGASYAGGGPGHHPMFPKFSRYLPGKYHGAEAEPERGTNAPMAAQPASGFSSERTPHFHKGLGAWVVWGLLPLVPALTCCLEKNWGTEP